MFSWKIWDSTTLEAATTGVLWKKVLLKISQNSQENTCAGASFFIKKQAWGLKKLWYSSFFVNLAKF